MGYREVDKYHLPALMPLFILMNCLPPLFNDNLIRSWEDARGVLACTVAFICFVLINSRLKLMPIRDTVVDHGHNSVAAEGWSQE